MNIDIADAAIVQAKLWDNPTLSISDVSFWSSKSQREGEEEVIPPLFGAFGKNTQFSVELSQLIQTAGKRGKLVEREQTSKEISIQEFEIVLRELKCELRASVNELQYLQSYKKILETQKQSMSRLIDSYSKQLVQGNISLNELLRLQSVLLEVENEINELHIECNSAQKKLKALINADSDIYIEIEDIVNVKNVYDLSLANLIEVAMEYRPEIKTADLQTKYYDKSLNYEKSLRVPDLTVSAGYDRGGGVWKNFIGIGISIDLPLFNRNQGNIKAAKIGKARSEYVVQQQKNTTMHEIAEAYENYLLTYNFYKKINDNSLSLKLDDMPEAYSRNFLNKNISMLEYIDFMNSYKTHKQTILSVRKNLAEQLNKLQYVIGTDIK